MTQEKRKTGRPKGGWLQERASRSETLAPGSKVKIKGLAFGAQYERGVTTDCPAGHETTLVICMELEP